MMDIPKCYGEYYEIGNIQAERDCGRCELIIPCSDETNEKRQSDGSTASYYELPEGATELQDIISFLNCNAQMGEIGRAGCVMEGVRTVQRFETSRRLFSTHKLNLSDWRSMKKTKLYLTAPTIGHYAERIRHEIFDHVFDELESCGYEMTGYIFDSDKIIIIDIPGWEQCDRVANDIASGTCNNICIELMELCEVM